VELRQLRALLRAHRLVTLTGVGGVGKTRLALHAAAELAPRSGGAVWFVELAPIADEQLVEQAVASTLGVREAPGSPLLASVVAHLRAEPGLLVLDNCEHLIDAAGRVAATLMQGCPELRVLATSREPLRCEGEAIQPLPPLSVPRRDSGATDVLRSEAVQLFVERAASSAGFVFDDDSASAVAAVCQRLDGVPLALELAASMLRATSPGMLASRLDQSLRVLRAGPRSGAARHESLEATIDWSYQLLTQPERRVFERLSVFAGGASLEAAEAVCAAPDLEPRDVLPTLAALVDKSLVVAETVANGSMRYRQLETLREYAAARLAEQGDEAATRDRHADFFRALARVGSPGGHITFHTSVVERLAAEHDNLRAALRYLSTLRDDRLLVLAADLGLFWFIRGHMREGAGWLDAALATAPNASPGVRARGLRSFCTMLWPLGEVDRVVGLVEEGMALARAANETWEASYLMMLQAIVTMLRGHNAGAVPVAHEAVTLARATGDEWLEAITLHILASAHELNGNAARAEALYADEIRIARRNDDEWILGYALGNLATLVAQRDLHQAEAMSVEALRMLWRAGDVRIVANMLVWLAVMAARTRRMVRAARLLGAADAQHERLGASPEMPPDGLDDLRAATSSGELSAARERGRGLTLQAAIDEACGEGERDVVRATPRNARLTRRELEIAALVAQGLSNLQIAQRLVITEGTTQNHLSHILDKLGLTSRTQVAAWLLARNPTRKS
jgi:predicted ATPase/DNA-binding NarL/FixJ family response regulator